MVKVTFGDCHITETMRASIDTSRTNRSFASNNLSAKALQVALIKKILGLPYNGYDRASPAKTSLHMGEHFGIRISNIPLTSS